MASIISMTSIAAVYTGHQWAQSLLVAIATFAHTTGHMGPARSIRSQIKWIFLMPVRPWKIVSFKLAKGAS
jgi:acyl transferase domain-containing protein